MRLPSIGRCEIANVRSKRPRHRMGLTAEVETRLETLIEPFGRARFGVEISRADPTMKRFPRRCLVPTGNAGPKPASPPGSRPDRAAIRTQSQPSMPRTIAELNSVIVRGRRPLAATVDDRVTRLGVIRAKCSGAFGGASGALRSSHSPLGEASRRIAPFRHRSPPPRPNIDPPVLRSHPSISSPKAPLSHPPW